MLRYIPFGIIAAILLLALGAAKLVRYRTARTRRRSPLGRKAERFPGQVWLRRLDEVNAEIAIRAGTLLSVPIAIYAASLSQMVFGRPFDRIEALSAAVIAIVFLGYTLFRLRGFLQERQLIRLGCEGRMIVGQTLNRMMLAGWRVYHDFPAENAEIDHILVGAKGVFAILTRVPSRGLRDGVREYTVTYDGRALHFAGDTDIDMIEQAGRQAGWLSQWLGQAIGEEIPVRAIIALPGWLVRRTAPDGIPIVNPKQFDSLFEHIPPRPLSPEMIARIVLELDRKSRDMAPAA